MEVTTQSSLINNFASTVILNFNMQVVINLFLYMAAATSGILITYKLISFLLEQLIGHFRYKWADRDKRKMDEIRELNNKMQDRLVEVNEIVEKGKTDKKTESTKMRLLYNSARLRKYDQLIPENVNRLLGIIYNEDGKIDVKNHEQAKRLIKNIRTRVDKLWFG